ncbi:unnamed protein product [Brassica oleracea]
MRKFRQFRRRRLIFRGMEVFKALRRRLLDFDLYSRWVICKRDGGYGLLNPGSAGFVALDEISMLIDKSSPKKGARPWKMHVNQGGFR